MLFRVLLLPGKVKCAVLRVKRLSLGRQPRTWFPVSSESLVGDDSHGAQSFAIFNQHPEKTVNSTILIKPITKNQMRGLTKQPTQQFGTMGGISVR